MSFEEFRVPPRFALDCRRWANGPRGRRKGSLASTRQSEINADERQRRIRAYAPDHRSSEAEAERELFGLTELSDTPEDSAGGAAASASRRTAAFSGDLGR